MATYFLSVDWCSWWLPPLYW